MNLLEKQRQKNNFRILNRLTEIVHRHPELRFQQILYVFKVIEENVDKFNEESVETLEKLEKTILSDNRRNL